MRFRFWFGEREAKIKLDDAVRSLPFAAWDTYDSLYRVVLAVDALHAQNVVAEVERLKLALLVEQHDNGAAGPVKPFAEQLSAKRGKDK